MSLSELSELQSYNDFSCHMVTSVRQGQTQALVCLKQVAEDVSAAASSLKVNQRSRANDTCDCCSKAFLY